MSTTVRISETYDLSTKVNKMGLVGIHTPNADGIKALYPGLCLNHRYLRIVGCDITLACASMLPADPLQIGTEAGSIAPQDMFNPILYTACSNDSFNSLMARIYGASNVGTGMSITQAQFNDNAKIFDQDGDQTAEYDDFDLYYGLLASPDGFRKAMPQAGLEMKGLYPIVYQMIAQYGNVVAPSPTGDGTINEIGADGYSYDISGIQLTGIQPYQFRGPSMRMPRIPLHYSEPVMRNEYETLPIDSSTNYTIPQTYVGLIITPPAKLNRLYYRMKVTWTLSFEEVIPLSEINLGVAVKTGDKLYATDYAEQSANMTSKSNMVDARNADLDLVMTSSK